ncbi:MAG: hypothetical protein HC852_10340 [Acaryochloridaceae cyanobacterium RU_4_10]|nr:hypothetical protein [Acaryochloridaceae cyanobacterium RU_4_10]
MAPASGLIREVTEVVQSHLKEVSDLKGKVTQASDRVDLLLQQTDELKTDLSNNAVDFHNHALHQQDAIAQLVNDLAANNSNISKKLDSNLTKPNRPSVTWKANTPIRSNASPKTSTKNMKTSLANSKPSSPILAPASPDSIPRPKPNPNAFSDNSTNAKKASPPNSPNSKTPPNNTAIAFSKD